MSKDTSLSPGYIPIILPGVVINHSPASTKVYIGSPSIAVADSGEYIASHDLFGPGSSCDTTCVFASSDRGQTWKKRSVIHGQWWSTLFLHRGDLYLMGTTKEYGYGIIRKSVDAGKTWSEPKDAHSGFLLADGMYHCAPVPLVQAYGRLWRAMEEYMGPNWGAFNAFVMSIDEQADLLNASNWNYTNRIQPSIDWLDGKFGGFLEGNVCVAPGGEIVNLLRVQHPSYVEYGALMTVGPGGTKLMFDPASGFFHMPGGSKKFTIRYDTPTRRYYSLLNALPEHEPIVGRRPDQVRNRLFLASSLDLRNWELHRTILEHPDVVSVGFQYVDWLFEGEDIIAAVRTAYPEADGALAHNAHDANWLTFHRIERFRGQQ